VRAKIRSWVWIWILWWRKMKNVTFLACGSHFSRLTAPILFKLVAIESLYWHYIRKMPLDFLLRLSFLKYFNRKFIWHKIPDKLLGSAASRTVTLNARIQFFFSFFMYLASRRYRVAWLIVILDILNFFFTILLLDFVRFFCLISISKLKSYINTKEDLNGIFCTL